jgi:histidine triad (HIT) family protein
LAGNIFLDIMAGRIPCDKVYEDDEVFAFRDINPAAPTHILILPKKPIATLNDLTEEDARLVGRLFLVARQLATQEGIAEAGYRTVFNCNAGAGQSVFQLHLHLLGGRDMAWPPG